MSTSVLLFEAAFGYALFECQRPYFSSDQPDLQFSEIVREVTLRAFQPFTSPAEALENINELSEGLLSDNLRNFLEVNLPKSKKKIILGVGEKNLGGAIKAALNLECSTNESVRKVTRCIRQNADKLLPDVNLGEMLKAQLSLGHSYARAKVKFNVNRADNMIIQAIAVLDNIDKDINTFAMRVREWYGWHFPELVQIEPDTGKYCRLVKTIQDRSTLTEDSVEQLSEILDGDIDKAAKIVAASRMSMGSDISPVDLINVLTFTDRVNSLVKYRSSMQNYLAIKMAAIAPSLTAITGDVLGARLIQHAGSMTNLCKAPASTLQILGAEKALFRALKNRTNTPKYGILFNNSFLTKSRGRAKARMSRVVANKCSIAARMDNFSDNPSPAFGVALRAQLENRFSHFQSGTALEPYGTLMKKNYVPPEEFEETEPGSAPSMRDATQTSPPASAELPNDDGKKEVSEPEKKKKDKKRRLEQSENVEVPEKKKKAKKRHQEESESVEKTVETKKEEKTLQEESERVEVQGKKKKKSKKRALEEPAAEETVGKEKKKQKLDVGRDSVREDNGKEEKKDKKVKKKRKAVSQ